MSLRKALVFMAVVTAPVAVQAQDHAAASFTGTWELAVPIPQMPIMTFELEQDGERITGTADLGDLGTMALGGSVQGHEIDFVLELLDGPHPLTMSCKGMVEAGKISGTMVFDEGERTTWTLTRVDGGADF